MKWWHCSGCRTKEAEIEYLRGLVNRLLDKAGVIDRTKLAPPEPVEETEHKEDGAFVYGE